MFLDYFGYYLYNILTIFAIYLIVFKREYVIKHKKEVIIMLITLLVYSQYRRYGARLFTPSFSYSVENLPIHFCRFSALMTLMYLITKNKIIKGFVYFQSGLGIFSVLIPGGYFFIMTQSWRSYTYMVDHAVLAIMPFFLILIDNYTVNKRDLVIALLYSILVPILVLPIALATDYNAYYVLDGVFARDLVGDNQFLIMLVMLLGLIVYNFLMYFIGNKLQGLTNRTFYNSDNLFAPKWPWIAISSFLTLGVIVGIFFVRPVPDYLTENTETYYSKPYSVQREDYVIYKGLGSNDELLYFIESLDGLDVHVLDQTGEEIPQIILDNPHVSFFDAKDVDTNQVIILLIKNQGKNDESIKTFTISIDSTYTEFMHE